MPDNTHNDKADFSKRGYESVWSFFITHFRVTYLLIIAIVLFGVISIISIPKESAPEVDIPVVVVTTTLPGASPVDVEELVTDEIEASVQSLTDIDTMTSNSRQGFSQVVINFRASAEGREKLTDVRDRLSGIESDLPSDASEPNIQQISFSDVPILRLTLSGPLEPAALDQYAQTLQADLERISQVSQVSISGAPDRVIKVELDPARVEQYGLSPTRITQAIGQANSNIPIGSIETAGGNYTVSLDGRLLTAEDVRTVVVASQNRTPVLLEDVAVVQDTFAQSDTLTRASANGSSQAAVTLQLFKVSGEGNILAINDEARSIIGAAQAEYLPESVTVNIVQNDADVIRNDLNNLMSSGALTVVIVFLVLVLFLGWRPALLASVVVPLTFLLTLGWLAPLGYTINFITLFSLILALGILVDTAIVVTEATFANLNEGMDVSEAVFTAIGEFQKPLIAGTLTTVFVFLPMLLTTGTIGKFIESIPITITLVLLSAIFSSLAIVTMLAVRFLKPESAAKRKGSFVQPYIDRAYRWYNSKLDWVLARARRGTYLLVTMGVLFVVAVGMVGVGVVNVEFFPAGDVDIIFVDVENPVGTPLAETNQHVSRIESVLIDKSYIESYVASIGSASNQGSVAAGGSRSHLGSVVINLTDDERASSFEIVRELERDIAGLVPSEVTVSQPEGGPAQGQPVQVQLFSNSLEELDAASQKVAAILEDIEGTRNVEDGVEESAGEFSISIDRRYAGSLGLDPTQIALVLRSAVAGTEATVVKTDGDDIDVEVTYALTTETEGRVGSVPAVSVSQLESLTLPTAQGSVPLSAVADITLTNSRASVDHFDGDRVVTVSAGLTEIGNVATIISELQTRLEEEPLSENVTISYAGQSEDITESFTSLGQAMLIGILAIFALLIWQFKSYRQPLFVLVTIPLAMIGVFFGLAITAQPLSFPGFIGVVALAGIVVNNAIILIDSINNSREAGLSIREAVKESAESRLQPILLTTISTVLAMIPLVFSDPTWAPLAYSIIFGLSFSTVLTLFVVPVLYTKFMQKQYLDEPYS